MFQLRLIIIGLLAFAPLVNAKGLKLTPQQMDSVVRIATDISLLQPHLPQVKYFEFGLAIFRASERYKVDPKLLISIAQQETSFRENLPEGRAGEIGICQIRKNWLKDHRFVKAFGRVSKKRLGKTANSFMYAAWIINGLRKTKRDQGKVPYWTYYNANTFKYRHRYYRYVNRYLSQLKAKGTSRLLASVKYVPKKRVSRAPASKPRGTIRDVIAKITPVTKKKFLRPAPKTEYRVRSTPDVKFARKRAKKVAMLKASSAGWIGSAIEGLTKKRSKDSRNLEKRENLREVSYKGQVRRTASELGVKLR